MKTDSSWMLITIIAISMFTFEVSAESETDAYELLYEEQEPGTDSYQNRYLVTDAYIRIDDPADDSGYILFDKQVSTIYSVSHVDESILVIKDEIYNRPDMKDVISIDYTALSDAPKVASGQVYNYRVSSSPGKNETCMDIHLVEGLLPEVTKMLEAYQRVVASQQARVLKNTPEEFRSTCFLYDQVYNDGRYYEKGLPIQEWHSNERKKSLTSYSLIKVHEDLFTVPGAYRQYSID